MQAEDRENPTYMTDNTTGSGRNDNDADAERKNSVTLFNILQYLCLYKCEKITHMHLDPG